MKDRLELLWEMLRAAEPDEWDTLRGTFKDGYACATAVVNRWVEMTSAPAATRQEPLTLGGASCTEAS